MEYISDKQSRSYQVVQKVKSAAVRFSVAAAIVGASVAGVAVPGAVHAQEHSQGEAPRGQFEIKIVPDTNIVDDASSISAGISTGGYAYLANSHNATFASEDRTSAYEPLLYLDYLAEIKSAMSSANRDAVRSSTYPESLISPHEASKGRQAATTIDAQDADASLLYLDYLAGIRDARDSSKAFTIDAPSVAAASSYRSPVMPDQNDGRDVVNLANAPVGGVQATTESTLPPLTASEKVIFAAATPIASIDQYRSSDPIIPSTASVQPNLAFSGPVSSYPSIDQYRSSDPIIPSTASVQPNLAFSGPVSSYPSIDQYRSSDPIIPSAASVRPSASTSDILRGAYDAQQPSVAVSAPATPMTSIAQSFYDPRPGYDHEVPAPMHTPVTPIASVDHYRYVYADSQVPIEQQAYESGATKLVATSDGWFVSENEAAQFNPSSSVAVSPADKLRYVFENGLSSEQAFQQMHQLAAQPSVAINALVTPIVSADPMCNIYENVHLCEQMYQDYLASKPKHLSPTALDPLDELRYVYENSHVTADVLNGVLLAQCRTPVVARPIVSGSSLALRSPSRSGLAF